MLQKKKTDFYHHVVIHLNGQDKGGYFYLFNFFFLFLEFYKEQKKKGNTFLELEQTIKRKTIYIGCYYELLYTQVL